MLFTSGFFALLAAFIFAVLAVVHRRRVTNLADFTARRKTYFAAADFAVAVSFGETILTATDFAVAVSFGEAVLTAADFAARCKTYFAAADFTARRETYFAAADFAVAVSFGETDLAAADFTARRKAYFAAANSALAVSFGETVEAAAFAALLTEAGFNDIRLDVVTVELPL
jgi:aspartokinase